MKDQSILKGICDRLITFAESSDYQGYNKHDALNSPLLHAISFNKWLRLASIQIVMRSPINLRPILEVPLTINPKGMALWTMAYLNLYHRTKNQEYLTKAQYCLSWLLDNSAKDRGYSGHCWGYPYPWQDGFSFFAPKGTPNCVVTCFVGRALIYAYEITGDKRYLNTARDSVNFLLNDLRHLYETDKMLCLSYQPVDMRVAVMDTSALAGVFLAQVAKHSDDPELNSIAYRLMNYVVDKQTNYGAWFYTHPPGDSHITHDNYHTGFILDAILDYMDITQSNLFIDAYHKGLKYYRNNLFLENGTPKWMNDRVYPFDIHGSAQGIITFCKAAKFNPEYGNFAFKIADWAIKNLYNHNDGYFYYQQGRFFKHKFTLMRWCNAWMCKALSELLLMRNEGAETSLRIEGG